MPQRRRRWTKQTAAMSFSALNATPNIGRPIEFSAPFKRADLIASNAKPRSILGAGCETISNGNEADRRACRRASIYSAFSISLHAGGSADIRIGFGLTDGFGSASFLANHQSRSLPQPSSVGGIGCALQSVLSFGQLMRIWKW